MGTVSQNHGDPLFSSLLPPSLFFKGKRVHPSCKSSFPLIFSRSGNLYLSNHSSALSFITIFSLPLIQKHPIPQQYAIFTPYIDSLTSVFCTCLQIWAVRVHHTKADSALNTAFFTYVSLSVPSHKASVIYLSSNFQLFSSQLSNYVCNPASQLNYLLVFHGS